MPSYTVHWAEASVSYGHISNSDYCKTFIFCGYIILVILAVKAKSAKT